MNTVEPKFYDNLFAGEFYNPDRDQVTGKNTVSEGLSHHSVAF